MRKITVMLILSSIVALAHCRGKTEHSLGKILRHKYKKMLADSPRRLNLPRFAMSKSEGFFGDISRGIGSSILENVARMPISNGQQQPYPSQYPQNYPINNPVQYPAEYMSSEPPIEKKIVNGTSVPSPNLAELEESQNKVAEKLKKAQIEADKLRLSLHELKNAMGVNERKGVNIETDVVTPNEIEEAESIKQFEEAAAQKTQYSPPIIVLLPSEITPRDKLEFARALACKGKGEMGENAKLVEMASIKGKTMKELEEEIKETEKELEKNKIERKKIHDELRKVEKQAIKGENVGADIKFLKDDLQDKDKTIEILIKKLKAMEKRKYALNINIKAEDNKERHEKDKKNKHKKHSKLHNLFKKKHKKEKKSIEEEEE